MFHIRKSPAPPNQIQPKECFGLLIVLDPLESKHLYIMAITRYNCDQVIKLGPAVGAPKPGCKGLALGLSSPLREPAGCGSLPAKPETSIPRSPSFGSA